MHTSSHTYCFECLLAFWYKFSSHMSTSPKFLNFMLVACSPDIPPKNHSFPQKLGNEKILATYSQVC